MTYVGFFTRFTASLIDTVFFTAISLPLLLMIYGENYQVKVNALYGFWDLIISWVMPLIVALVFWHLKSATPGKIIFSAKIVDAHTGNKPTTIQFLIRLFGYIIAIIPFSIGIIWIIFDKKKQGWHDKLANTVVITNH